MPTLSRFIFFGLLIAGIMCESCSPRAKTPTATQSTSPQAKWHATIIEVHYPDRIVGDASALLSLAFHLPRIHQAPETWGFINARGEFMKEASFTGAAQFSEGLAAVQFDDRCGYINETGQIVVPIQFLGAMDFHDGMARVQTVAGRGGTFDRGQQWGLINAAGKFVIPSRYESMTDYSDELVGFWNGRGGYMDAKGKIVIPGQFYGLHQFSDGLAKVVDYPDINPRYIDPQGNVKIRIKDNGNGETFSEGLAAVEADGRWGFINTRGDVVISYSFTEAKSFSEGRALVSTGNAWGVIDQAGNWIVPPTIPDDPEIREYHQGLLYAQTQDGWNGYFDLGGKRVITLKANEIGGDFSGGVADVVATEATQPQNLIGYPQVPLRWIDEKGNVIASRKNAPEKF